MPFLALCMSKYNSSYFSILKGRKKWYYRVLEALIGSFSFGFLFAVIGFSAIFPAAVSLFLILYGFMWFLKVSVSSLYILYSFKTTIRYEKIDWKSLLGFIESNPEAALEMLKESRKLGKSSDDWQNRIDEDISELAQIQDTDWVKSSEIYHVINIITYNEDPSILHRSLQAVYQNAFNLSKTIVVLSQEQRMGDKHNQNVRDKIAALSNGNFNCQEFQEDELGIVYDQDHTQINYKYTKNDIKLSADKLNVIFTAHPDGMVGEIKGSGPNANWGARQASLLITHLGVDPKKVLLTKLDADHRIGKNYLEVLTYNYILSPNKDNVGFEPIPVFVNNFYQTNFIPRIVGIQSTFWVMTQSILPDDLHFYMCYAVPMHTLQKAGFWYREVISEECFLFYQCFFANKGNFKTLPIYAPILVDAVEGENFLVTFQNQYKQLQRWAWGAMEEFPYIFYKFFIDPNGEHLDTRDRVKMVYLNFTNSIFWATSGLVFTFGVFFPKMLGGKDYNASPISLSLQNISLFFTVFSFSLLGFFAYIIYTYLGPKIIEFSEPSESLKAKPQSPKIQQLFTALQAIYMPIVYIIIMPFPALDAQFRAIFGKYLGYWVTPKGGKK
jgi:hypothetical protein